LLERFIGLARVGVNPTQVYGRESVQGREVDGPPVLGHGFVEAFGER